jgi:hypothetical protein
MCINIICFLLGVSSVSADLAISNQTPGKHPKENILRVKHGESLKSRMCTRLKRIRVLSNYKRLKDI